MVWNCLRCSKRGFTNNQINERQRKAIKRLLDTRDFTDGISRKKYKALCKTTDATAARDLADLVEKKVFEAIGQGRGRRYLLI